jgi:hypothetical protein
VQQAHQASPLAKLLLDGAPCDELLALDHKCGGEIGAIRGERSRHERHSLQKVIFGSIHFPHSLPPSLRQPTLEFFMKRSTMCPGPLRRITFRWRRLVPGCV